jgi:hypothetical protein
MLMIQKVEFLLLLFISLVNLHQPSLLYIQNLILYICIYLNAADDNKLIRLT